MGKAIIGLFFIIGFIVFSFVKFAIKGTKEAYRAVNKPESYTTDPQQLLGNGSAADRALHTAAGSLMLQRSLISMSDDPLPDMATDNWSLGYVFGFTDAILQHNGIGMDETGYYIHKTVFMVLFNDAKGIIYFDRVNRLNDDPDRMAGQQSGCEECFKWLRQEESEYLPYGWANYYHDQKDEQAKEIVA